MKGVILRDREYRRVHAAERGLLFIRGVPGVGFNERVLVRDSEGKKRVGQVIRTSGDLVLVQVFEGTDNLDLENTWVRFLDEPFELALSPDLLGRNFNGIGEPRDHRPPIVSSLRRNVNGAPVNPAARSYPREFIETGISTIDIMNSLVRGQKLPVFSGAGLPHDRLAIQIAHQAHIRGDDAGEHENAETHVQDGQAAEAVGKETRRNLPAGHADHEHANDLLRARQCRR